MASFSSKGHLLRDSAFGFQLSPRATYSLSLSFWLSIHLSISSLLLFTSKSFTTDASADWMADKVVVRTLRDDRWSRNKTIKDNVSKLWRPNINDWITSTKSYLAVTHAVLTEITLGTNWQTNISITNQWLFDFYDYYYDRDQQSTYFRYTVDPSSRRDNGTGRHWDDTFHYEDRCIFERKRFPTYWPGTERNNHLLSIREDIDIGLCESYNE